MLLGVAAFVVGLVVILSPLAREDAVVDAGAGPVTVDLPAGEERALFARDGGSVSCTAVDADGDRVDLRPVSAEFTYNEWTAVARFDTGAGDVTFDCPAAGDDGEIRVAQAPSTTTFVVGLLVAVVGALGLGFGGLAVLIVTGILYAVRPASA